MRCPRESYRACGFPAHFVLGDHLLGHRNMALMTDNEMLKKLEEDVELDNKELSVLVFKLVQFSVQQVEHNKGGYQVVKDIQACIGHADDRLAALEKWTHDIMPSNSERANGDQS